MSGSIPQFPDFKKLTLEDRSLLHDFISQYQSQIAELTFTNLYIWRHFYETEWAFYKDWLLILFNPMGWGCYFLQPVGPPSRKEAVDVMLDYLMQERDQPDPRIDRVDERLLNEIQDSTLQIENLRDQYDYVYNTSDLIHLKGRKFHKKKNHINRFKRSYDFAYKEMDETHLNDCMRVLKRWCNWRDCEKNPVMLAEFKAVDECLTSFNVLGVRGGVLLVNGQIEAFTVGELLNEDTAVIHIEKADPKIPEAFPMINQQFCEHAWADVPFINREQDLGNPGLRKAKESYHPVKLIPKSRIRIQS